MFAYSEKDKTKDRTVPLRRLRLIVNRPRLKPLVAAALFMVFPFSQIVAQQSNVAPYNFTDNRNARFCEVFLIKDGNVDIYNTSGVNEGPAELWDAMDLKQVAREHGADIAQKNGPKYWMMDEQTVSIGETKSFGGIEARWVARIPASFFSGDKGSVPYEPFTTKKNQRIFYAKGKKDIELDDSDRMAYV